MLYRAYSCITVGENQTIDQEKIMVDRTNTAKSERTGTLVSIGLPLVLALMQVIYGCGGGSNMQSGPQVSFYKLIKENTLLNKKEKALARRMYDFVHSDVAKNEIEELADLADALESPLYEKWGLGKRENLSLEEQAYVSAIGLMEATIKLGEAFDKTIKDRTLTEEQKTFLKKRREELSRDRAGIKQEEQDAESKYAEAFIKALFGHERLNDSDLLVCEEVFGYLDVVPFILSE